MSVCTTTRVVCWRSSNVQGQDLHGEALQEHIEGHRQAHRGNAEVTVGPTILDVRALQAWEPGVYTKYASKGVYIRSNSTSSISGTTHQQRHQQYHLSQHPQQQRHHQLMNRSQHYHNLNSNQQHQNHHQDLLQHQMRVLSAIPRTNQPSFSADLPSKTITIKPNFDLQRLKHQLEQAASEQARLALLL